jgi:hypothetical protein
MIDTLVEQFNQPMLKKRKLEQEGSLVWALVRPHLVEETDAELNQHVKQHNLRRERRHLENDRNNILDQETMFGNDFYNSFVDWQAWAKDLEAFQRLQMERMALLEQQTTCRLVQKHLIQ